MLSASEFVIIFALLFIFLYLYLTQHFNYWKKRNVPYKTPLFLFGNLFDVVVKGMPIAKYLGNLYHEFSGPYFGFFGMNEPFLVLRDTSIIKRVLVTNFQAFSDKTFLNDEKIDPIFSNVLFTQKHKNWNALRSTLTPLFTTGKIKAMYSYIQGSGQNMCQFLRNKLNEEIDATELAGRYSTDVIATLAFGIDVRAFESEKCEFKEKGKTQFARNLRRALQPLAYIFAHPLVKLFRLKFIEPEAANYFRGVFNKTIKIREEANIQKGDLLDTLLKLKKESLDKHGFQFSGDKLVAQAIIFYVAGNEGISNAISLTLLELSIRPDFQARLRQEIQDVIALHGSLTYESIQDMKYLNMVMCETFRKYPFTAFVHRRCTQKYLIKETGLVIEPGLKILIPLQGLHSDPQYFPNPDVYDPERFNQENKSNRTEHCYLPFGGGPRGCLGNRYALLSIQLGIIQLVKNYQIEKGASVKYPLEFGVSFFLYSKEGINLVFSKADN